MKIALCISGLFRSFEKVWPIMQKNIINPNLTGDNEIDIFICTTTYNNHKYRFRVDNINILNKLELENKIRNIIGSYLKDIIINEEQIKNDKCKQTYKKSRFDKIHRVLELRKKYEQNHNFKYDMVIFHRFDVIFTNWQIADKYYEDRKEGEYREPGILKIQGRSVGTKNHGCCCIQKCPNLEEIDTKIILPLNMSNNELHCYEDFHIGHNYTDFFYCNSSVADKLSSFFKNYSLGKILDKQKLNVTFNNERLYTIQSYNIFYKPNILWYTYNDSKYESVSRQMRLYLVLNNIEITKQIRFTQDCAVLYIR